MKVVNKLKGRKKTLIMDPKVSGVLNQCIPNFNFETTRHRSTILLRTRRELDASVDDVVFFVDRVMR